MKVLSQHIVKETKIKDLFVLCMKVLVKEVREQKWKTFKPCRQGPEVFHIFFADNLLLFREASFSQARLMEHVLADFCGVLGQ